MTQAQFPLKDALAQLRGRFEIARILREGGQGVVVDAVRRSDLAGTAESKRVALKFYFAKTSDERVEREIRALEGYPHDCLANLLEHGYVALRGSRTRYLAWEFIEGEPLDHRLKKGPASPILAAHVGRDVASAIEHIWQKRIVHRDVNPKNIMVRSGERRAVLIDLGVARHLDETPLTSPGRTWGTLGYFSPEQYRTEPNLTCASDIYSLGISLQELLCGRHPTDGDQARLYGGAPKTSMLSPTTPPDVCSLIDRMLQHRAAFRPRPSTVVSEFSRTLKGS